MFLKKHFVRYPEMIYTCFKNTFYERSNKYTFK